MEPDLDELQLELGALLHRACRRELLPLALADDEEVVEMDALFPVEVQAPLRERLELGEP